MSSNTNYNNTTGTGTTGTTGTTHSGAKAGSDTAKGIKSGLTGIHGAGEAIRGTINSAINTAFHDDADAARNQQIADSGITEMKSGNKQTHNAGVTPVDTDREKAGYSAAGPGSTTTTTRTTDTYGGTTGTTGSTNYGPHSSNLANKADPRYDSDLDHRGTTTGSTNYGPHSTNVGNKADPRVDSDLDGRANPGSHQTGAPAPPRPY